MVADITEQPKGKTAPIAAQRKDQVRAWAPVIGVRAAARKFGVNENTALYWSHKESWELPAVFQHAQRVANQRSISAHEAQQSVIAEQGEESRLYLAAAGLKASYEAAQSEGAALLSKDKSAAVLNHARSLDVVHGWTAQRTAAPIVQIANVIMPTPEEKAQREAIDQKLDAITRRLTEQHQARISAHTGGTAA